MTNRSSSSHELITQISRVHGAFDAATEQLVELAAAHRNITPGEPGYEAASLLLAAQEAAQRTTALVDAAGELVIHEHSRSAADYFQGLRDALTQWADSRAKSASGATDDDGEALA